MYGTRLINRSLSATALAAIVGACALAAPAAATGGRDIASAPAVVYGDQQFGNTATDSDLESCDVKSSWWLLSTAAGDRITIDFEGDGVANARVWPIGTTDFNLEQTDDVAGRRVGSNGKAELVFKASATGNMPLSFSTYDCNGGYSVDPGPYDFTAYVEHGLSLSLSHKANRSRTGTVKVGVHSPEGGDVDDPAITVELQAKRSGSSWKGYGSAPVADSRATISYKLPKSFRKKSISVRAVSTGEGYLKTTSRTDHSKVG
jgi:hypothetical protein